MDARPDKFYLDPYHPLWNGCAFAGLGQLPGSTHYHDSNVRGNHGTLYNSATWDYDGRLGRLATKYVKATSDYMKTDRNVTLSGDWSIAIWFKLVNYASSEAMLFGEYGGGWCYSYSVRTRISWAANTLSYVLRANASDTWFHLAFVSKASNVTQYFNGVEGATQASDGADFILDSIAPHSNGLTGSVGDLVAYNRAISLSEIGIFANPADPMLGGALWAPSNRLTMIMSGGGAAGFAGSSNIIGGGICC